MQKDNKFFDDLAKMASSAGGTLLEMKREMESGFTQQMEKVMRKMDLVSREDFKVVKEMAAKARAEQERLEKRIAELEKKLAAHDHPHTHTPVAMKKAAPKATREPATKDRAVRSGGSAKKAGTSRTAKAKK